MEPKHTHSESKTLFCRLVEKRELIERDPLSLLILT
jgi:hypothetical protein